MARIIDPFTQFFDDNGDPLVNGFLHFYESGTNNTDKDTFADINETIPNANPVPLDGAGRCPNVFGTGSYNVISYTSAMVQIQQFDPVSGDAFQGAFSTWNSATIYGVGDLVIASDDGYYRSISSPNQNQDPTTSPGQWEQVKFVGVWNTNVIYNTGDTVYGSDGISYISKTDDNLANNPTTDAVNWGNSAIPAWAAGATYSKGNIVYGSDGFLYGSTINSNTANDPVSDAENWNAIISDKELSITASVASSELTVGINPIVLKFRSATLTDGTTDNIVISSALSLTVPSGATLGTIDTIESRLILLAINNAGTAELAIVNLAGGVNLSEEGVISTTAIDATADSNNVVYSATARTNVPYRVVGFVDSTQTVAGTWAAAPSHIGGSGGNVLSVMSSFGYGQDYQDVSAGKAYGTNYYNISGKPIYIVSSHTSTVTAGALAAVVNGSQVYRASSVNTVALVQLCFVVPANSYYSINIVSGSGWGVNYWQEMK